MPTRDEILQQLINKVTALEARVDQLETPSDPWSEEFDPVPMPQWDQYGPIPKEKHVPMPLLPSTGTPTPDDPDEDTPEVLEAKRRIEEANAQDQPGKRHEQELQVSPGKDDSLTVTVLAPTKQQKFMRQGNSGRVIGNLPGLDHDTAKAAYIEGGPIWLHAFNRDHVVGLPDDLKTDMVRDVAITMPESAHELSRDILKVTDQAAQSAWAHGNAEAVIEEAEYRGN